VSGERVEVGLGNGLVDGGEEGGEQDGDGAACDESKPLEHAHTSVVATRCAQAVALADDKICLVIPKFLR
jgi:hypothetical protein